MAARGNRLVGVGRLGVAFLATAAVALGSALPAFAEEAQPAPPAETTPAGTTAADPPTPAPPAEPKPPAPPADSEPAPKEPPAEPDPAPTGEATGGGTTESPEPAPDSAPAETAPAEGEPTSAPKDAVKLEPAAPAAPAAPQPTATAPAPQPAVQPASSAPPEPVIVLENADADADAEPAATAGGPATAAETESAAAVIVSLRPRAASSPISLLPADEPVLEAVRSVAPIRAAADKLLVRQTCARPAARVPLSQDCKQARAVAGLRVTLTYTSRPEVRAAIARAVARVTIPRMEARPPPDSKAAKKHPVAEVRPIVPFGDSGHGVASDGFKGSTGSTSSSRLFALAAVPLKVPLPFRFARLRLPSRLPHGVIAAPPTARPG